MVSKVKKTNYHKSWILNGEQYYIMYALIINCLTHVCGMPTVLCNHM